MPDATNPKWARILGWVLHGLIGLVMIMAGSGKVFGFAPPAIVEGLTKAGLGDKIVLIGAGEMISAALLLAPRTLSLGLLLASGIWGGAICEHMTQHESYAAVAVLLALTWVGAFLRDPRTFGSFRGAPPRAASGPA